MDHVALLCNNNSSVRQAGSRSFVDITIMTSKNQGYFDTKKDSTVHKQLSELVGSLKLGNVWVLVQLIFGTPCPINQLNKSPNIA